MRLLHARHAGDVARHRAAAAAGGRGQGAGGTVRQSVPLYRLHGHRGRRNVRAGGAAGAAGSRRGCAAGRPGAGPGRRAETARQAAFAGFTPVADSAGRRPSPRSPAATPAGRKEGRGSQIDGGFTVPFPAAEVWAFMVDLPALASCLPGASIEEHEGDRVKGKIAIKFGPMSAAFNGAARLERDDAAMQAVFRGAGQDSLSQSRANGDIPVASAVARRDAGAREPAVFAAGAPGAVFAVRAGAGLRAPHDRGLRQQRHRPAAAAAAGEAPVQASFNPTAMFFSVLWARIKRWFGRGG